MDNEPRRNRKHAGMTTQGVNQSDKTQLVGRQGQKSEGKLWRHRTGQRAEGVETKKNQTNKAQVETTTRETQSS